LYPAARKPRLPARAAAVTRAAVVGPPAIGAASTGRSTGSDKSDDSDSDEFMGALLGSTLAGFGAAVRW
jgi:hypothetical protein